MPLAGFAYNSLAAGTPSVTSRNHPRVTRLETNSDDYESTFARSTRSDDATRSRRFRPRAYQHVLVASHARARRAASLSTPRGCHLRDSRREDSLRPPVENLRRHRGDVYVFAPAGFPRGPVVVIVRELIEKPGHDRPQTPPQNSVESVAPRRGERSLGELPGDVDLAFDPDAPVDAGRRRCDFSCEDPSDSRSSPRRYRWGFPRPRRLGVAHLRAQQNLFASVVRAHDLQQTHGLHLEPEDLLRPRRDSKRVGRDPRHRVAVEDVVLLRGEANVLEDGTIRAGVGDRLGVYARGERAGGVEDGGAAAAATRRDSVASRSA